MAAATAPGTRGLLSSASAMLHELALEPSSTVAPMPIRQSSPTVAAWTIAPSAAGQRHRMCSQVSQTTTSSQKLGIAVKSLAYYVTSNVGAKGITTVSEAVSRLGAQQDLPTVVLLPIMVGAGLPSMLYFATCRMQLSYKQGAHSAAWPCLGGQLINNSATTAGMPQS